jgi:hypothetical protein
VLAPLADAAVVLALAIVPLDMLLALIADKPAALPLNVAVTILAPKLPSASRRTRVFALLEVLPVVRALAIVPLEILLALIAEIADPLPETLVNEPVVPLKVVAFDVVAVIVLAANDPVESRNTMVFAPFDAEAVVLALSKVPSVIAEALMGAFAAAVSCP